MHLIKNFGLSERRSCKISNIHRSTMRYDRKPKDDNAIVKAIEEVLEKNSKYGCGMIHLKLRQKGIIINHKITERIYREQGLQLSRRKRRKKVTSVERLKIEYPKEPGFVWQMDFIHDSIAFNRKLKILTSIDPATNRSPIIHTGFSITGKDVCGILDRMKEKNELPKYFQFDNGPEFRSREVDEWCYRNNVKIIFTRPGKPVDNCHIESFNGTFRYECLNSHYFKTIKEANILITDWWKEYNSERPQKRLNGMTPIEFEDKLLMKTNPANGRKAG